MTNTNRDTFIKCVESINQLLKETEYLLNNIKDYPNYKTFWEGQLRHLNNELHTINKIVEVEGVKYEK